MGPECHQMNPDKRDTDDDLIQTCRGEGGVKMKAETGMMRP